MRTLNNSTKMGRYFAIAMILLVTTFVTGCKKGEEVGRLCDLGAEPESSETTVASPALDCITRTCVQIPTGDDRPGTSGTKGLCTAECSDNDDCERVPESPCEGGFVCTEATTVGPYCCRKLCICKDFIVVPEDGIVPSPAGCDPDNAANTCRNLPGRS